jgi:MFS transporter, DHA2 family, multidrug resistance protein
VKPEKAGSAAAVNETSCEFGFALGIATLGSLGAAVYRGLMANAVSSEVPQAAADIARDTLAGATVAAASLADPVGLLLLMTAREAFTQRNARRRSCQRCHFARHRRTRGNHAAPRSPAGRSTA